MNINQLTRENVRDLHPYSSARDDFKEENRQEMIFLDANENPFGKGLNRYPDSGHLAILKLLADKKQLAPEQILLGNGSDEVLDLIFRAFCEPKHDNIITVQPTYGMYSVLADINNVENKKVLLGNDFTLNVEEILAKSDERSKLLFLCSPNNPTGNSFSSSKIEKLIHAFNGIVVIDEAYVHFSEQMSWCNRLNDFSNLIVTQTFSKAYGLAGIRLGVCYASKEIIAILQKIKPPYNVNTLTLEKTGKVLENNSLGLEVKEIKQQKKMMEEAFAKITFIKKVYPSDANFLLVKVDDADKRYNQLIESGIVVRNRSKEPLCENCLRMTIGTEQENKKLIQSMQKIQ